MVSVLLSGLGKALFAWQAVLTDHIPRVPTTFLRFYTLPVHQVSCQASNLHLYWQRNVQNCHWRQTYLFTPSIIEIVNTQPASYQAESIILDFRRCIYLLVCVSDQQSFSAPFQDCLCPGGPTQDYYRCSCSCQYWIRVSKSCNHAIARLRKIFVNLQKGWNNKCKTENTGTHFMCLPQFDKKVLVSHIFI